MGSSFTSVHLRCDSARLDEITSLLDKLAGREGLSRAAPGEPADRSVVVVPGPRWTAVYDESADDQDEQVVAGLAAALSSGLVCAVFSILVHDSDVLRLHLYEAGRAKHSYDSRPGYFTGRLRSAGRPHRHAQAWSALLAEGRTEDDLIEVFVSDALFAEDALPALARALGADPARLAVGYRYLVEEPLPAHAVTLAYRLQTRPAWEAGVEGPPRLLTAMQQHTELYGAGPGIPAVRTLAAVGTDVVLSTSVLSVGGPGRGLGVEVEGSGPEVRWDFCRIAVGRPGEGQVVEAPLECGEGRWVAELPEVALAPGVPRGALHDPRAAMRLLRAQSATQLYVGLHGRGVAKGSADLRIRLWPLEHPDGGTRLDLGVDVRTTEGRPLRAPASVHPSQLEVLADRSRVVALVVLEPDGAAAHAQAIGAAIADHVPGIGRVAATRYPLPKGPAGGGLAAFLQMAGQPRTSTGKARGFLGGERFRELIRAWGESASLVDAVWLADAEVLPDFGSLAFGAGIIPSPGAVPAVALGVAGSPADLHNLETALIPVIDAAGGSLVQALLTRWGASPAVDQTAYELACGVHGQCTLERRWVERWLRGVGPGWLWLGPALRGAVGADALAGLAAAEVGASVRIQVRDVAVVEAALAELLPSAADWQEGMRLRFGG